MRVTLKQLSQELGLDYSTVSYALSGKGSINEATRQRVQEYAARRGYVPNGLARRMRNQKTKSLGLVLPDSILLYNELIQQLYRGAAEHDHELQIALTEFQEETEERAVRTLLEARVDGMIVRSRYGRWSDVPQGAALRQAATARVPVVTYGPTLEGSPFPAFELPLFDRSYRAATHLLELGHRHLACLLPVEAPIYGPHVSAIEGVQHALQEYSAAGDRAEFEVLVLESPETPRSGESGDAYYNNYLHEILPRHALGRGRALLRQALLQRPHPTGLICYNAVIAIGALQEAQEQGVRVPHDVALVSVTRGLLAELSPLSLTTCDVPPARAAQAVLQLLFDAMAGRATRRTRRSLEPELRVGATSDPQTTSNAALSAVRLASTALPDLLMLKN